MDEIDQADELEHRHPLYEPLIRVLLQQAFATSPEQLSSVMDFVEFLQFKQRASLGEQMRVLFRETQLLPGVGTITEDDIAAEIDAYRLIHD